MPFLIAGLIVLGAGVGLLAIAVVLIATGKGGYR